MRELGTIYLDLGWRKKLVKSKNLYYHNTTITVGDKSERLGHKPCVVWLTGLSGSGKSTVANALERQLFSEGAQTHILDGDNVRMGLNGDLGFSPDDRRENIRRIGEVANLFAQSGTILITAFISPYREDRARARKACKSDFLEVFVDANLETCEERDPKGLYKRARLGEIKGFTGIDAPYENPVGDDCIVIKTDTTTPDECAGVIVKKLRSMGVIK